MRRIIITLIGLGVLLAVGSATGVAQSVLNGTVVPRNVEVPAQADGPSTTLIRDYELFRRTRNASDDMGSVAGEYSRTGPGNPAGANPRLARRARLSDSSFKLWVTPSGEDGVCVMPLPPGALEVGAQCDTISQMSTAGQTLTYSPNDVYVYGLVPDGVDEVMLRLEDGSVDRLAVRDNVYFEHARQPTVSVSYTGPDGHKVAGPARSYKG